MGNVCGWLASCMYPEDQIVWQAAHNGDAAVLIQALARLTPQTRSFLEWSEPCSGRTPIAEAARRGHKACVEALVVAGANANAKDYKGNTPLHLACRYGRIEVVRYLLYVPHVACLDVNMAMLTPLDVARKHLRDDDCDADDHASGAVAYEQCIEELEKKFYVYSGWLYEKTESLLSLVSGISSLNSWRRRFCIVLQRGVPDVLELALFSMRPNDVRPACPTTVVLYHVRSGMVEVEDAKWFNRKRHTFQLTGSVQPSASVPDPRLGLNAQQLEFAAIDAEGLEMWRSFFEHQQNQLMAEQRRRQHPFALPDPPARSPRRPLETPMAPPPPPCFTEYSRRPSSATTIASSIHLDDEAEDEELRRAIEMSLEMSRQEELARRESATGRPGVSVSSAPEWADDADDASVDSIGIDAKRAVDSSSRDPTDSGAVEPSGCRSRHSFATIGECVVCFDGPQTAVCVPCGHNALCMSCAEELLDTTRECPVCRRSVREFIKLYRV
ncbi:hypothetical protein P43SY_001758 [Pythium insidiosum]|uniref:RING-type domain-containing protein n=1 Tax=Pythium insidiosum TaxID=114742 RepID=A0AAD5M9E4_PYTIN|nr:hypothetical protein P43SY_001758 [Pythium insidiosum]